MVSVPDMRRLAWVLALTLALLLLALAGLAHAAVVVSVVTTQAEAPVTAMLAGFRERFAGLGEDLDLEVYSLAADESLVAEQIASIRNRRPQVIFVLGSRALNTIASEVADIPVVFGLVLSEQLLPVNANVTGVVLDFPVATQLAWLQRLLPQARTIGVAYNPAENAARIADAREFARRSGLTLDAVPITSPRELPAALTTLARHADVLWGLSDQMVINTQTARSLLLFSFRNRIPFFGLSAAWVKAGALVALERDYQDIGRQCAELAQQVIAGASPASLPLQTPRKVLYTLNRRTAEQMKIEFPEKVLRAAQEVY
ncbi:ABC transporter substrate-binding protein [Desulfuromonas carbonis]|uniref:ABC transporter substrate-binding protein n=1 Tax=Desulfuromonas sp. DDH964 TaxID=1823759 RepID=UPI00078DF7C6|nr:ABC transporter substrate-binding protein [Desulfuromonas sp. DDH964]AMV71418.1 ABC transporter substrate-binding protein [Desulfuromonas sp. DDH964]